MIHFSKLGMEIPFYVNFILEQKINLRNNLVLIMKSEINHSKVLRIRIWKEKTYQIYYLNIGVISYFSV